MSQLEYSETITVYNHPTKGLLTLKGQSEVIIIPRSMKYWRDSSGDYLNLAIDYHKCSVTIKGQTITLPPDSDISISVYSERMCMIRDD